MHILFTDETNMPSDPGAKFFVYGGLMFPVEKLVDLDLGIRNIRFANGYQAGDELKFETNARPSQVTVDQARNAKEAVVNLCLQVGCKFIAYVILHAIAKNTPRDNLVSWAASHVISRFNMYLGDVANDFGIVAVDRLPISGDFRYLSEKFSHGLHFPRADEHVPLNRIVLLSATCINASHASSAMDIVLGSFRYCINQPLNVTAAQKMMANVTRLIWHDRDGEGNIAPFEKGLIMRPRYHNIQVATYKAAYDGLIAHINDLIKGYPDL